MPEPAERIRKGADTRSPPPNLRGYGEACAGFSWATARMRLDGLPGGGLNIAHEAVDRHLPALAGKVALRFLGRDGARRDVTFGELRRLTSRFAGALGRFGVGRGERVYSLCGRIPELYVAALGTLKAGAVFCPLFSAFGPEPVSARLSIGAGRVLVTTPALYEKKVKALRPRLPALQVVLLVRRDAEARQPLPEGTLDFHVTLAQASEDTPCLSTRPEDPALLHFTSGTTGTPKGALHCHRAVVQHHVTGLLALDLQPEDVFWCTADPGWVTGTSYGIVSPLTHGVTSVVDEADFEAERWYRLLEEQRVTVWYTAPTAVRMLMKQDAGLVRRFDLSALRFVASVGEPLNPEAVWWGVHALKRPIHDNWWQTETGGIMISNFRAMDVKPGSMGRPMPGVVAAIVNRGPGGKLKVETAPGVVGELALEPGWPSMFVAYLNDETRYRKCFADGWYLTGDLARVDADGYYWFVGRADDVIKSSGHLIGPFEVESALLEHPAVAEAGVIGVPDEVAGELVKAFVSLKPGFEDTPELRRAVLAHARKALGAAVAPKDVVVVPSLPRTRSGKIMRRLLKARELGLPEGDLSTLEGGA